LLIVLGYYVVGGIDGIDGGGGISGINGIDGIDGLLVLIELKLIMKIKDEGKYELTKNCFTCFFNYYLI
jgi:hypothetical protein